MLIHNSFLSKLIAKMSAPPANAVLDDPGLQAGLKGVNPAFGDLCVRVAGEVWGKPLIDQRTKALITVALDVANQGLTPESPYEPHIRMALKQGATFAQLEELLLFCCAYAGFNKCAPAFVRLSAIRQKIEAEAPPTATKVAKSNITLEILPNGSDVDMDALVAKLKAIQKDGLAWGESRLEPVAFGIEKLLLAIQIEDAKISAADIEKVVMSLNEGKEEDEGDVQSVEIATWQPQRRDTCYN